MSKQTFEDAMRRLEEIVEELESGDLSLDQTLKRFQDGIKLSRFCEKKLDETEKQVSLLLREEDGTIRETPFEEEAPRAEETGPDR